MADDARRTRVVCHLIERLDYGGAEMLVHSLTTGLQQRGYRSIVCCLQAGAIAGRLEHDGVRVHCLDLQRPSILEGPRFGRFVVAAVRGLARIVESEHVDIIHAHMPDPIIWAAAAGRLTHTAVVGTYHGHGNLPKGRRRWDPRNAIRRLLYRSAGAVSDRTIAVSGAVRDWLCREMGFDERKTVRLLNGVDTRAFARAQGSDQVRAELGLDGRAVIVSVGRLVRGKAHRYLVDAMTIVARRHPNAVLVLVGDGPERGRLEQQVRDLALTDRVRFAGTRPDIPTLLAMSAVFVLPSFSEGIPIALIEAMAAGTPVVATAVPGSLDVVVDERHGRLVPPGDAREIADAIGAVLADPAGAAERAARAQARVRASFDIEQAIAATARLYDEVLAERAAANGGHRAR